MVAPGGVREAMTTTAEDNIVRWFGRSGFAEVARRAKAPIFPVFTKRMRDVFLVLGGGLSIVQKLYEMTKLPFTPFIGPFIVKLTTLIGEPVVVDSASSRKEIAERARDALQQLMLTNA